MKASTFLQAAAGVSLLCLSAAALADNALTARPANILAGPDDSYPVVAQVDSDTPLQVMGCLDDWSYCDVAAQDVRGWLYAPDITYGYQGGYVPLYAYGPALGIGVVAFSVDNYWGRYYHDRPWYGRREEFIRRGPPHHHLPSGPRPSHSPPPREVVQHRPDNHSGGVRVSNADARRHEDTTHHEGERHDADRHGSAMAAPAHSPPPAREEAHARPAEHPAPTREEQHGPAAHAGPANHEAHPATREEHPAREPTHEEKRDEDRPH